MAAMQHLSYELILAFCTVIVRAGQAGINGLCSLCLAVLARIDRERLLEELELIEEADHSGEAEGLS